MIDTDKYVGHTPAPWKTALNDNDGHMDVIIAEDLWGRSTPFWISAGDVLENTATAELIADAPRILQAYKRLHTEFQEMLADFQNVETDMWRMRDRIEAILKGEY